MIKNTSVLKWFKKTMLIITIILVLLVLALTGFYFWAGSGTLSDEQLSEIISYRTSFKEPGEPEDTFTVMTYNIGYLSGMANSLPIRPPKTLFEKNMETFLNHLQKDPPHIIGFQEIDYHSHRSYYVDHLKAIAQHIGYPHAAMAVNWDKRYVPFPYWPPAAHFGPTLSGQAVLSRMPILETERIVLPKPTNKPFYYNHFYLDRLIQIVKIKLNAHTLIVLNVHLEAYHVETREIQAKQLLDVYRSYKDKYPVLLIGDFNCVPPDAPKKKDFIDEPEADFSGDKTITFFLNEPGLKPAYLLKHQGLTFPSGKPTRKLDYIFYTHETIELIDTHLIAIDSSDHLPLIMRFSFK
jgi:endonuclease/exonuclease/phosphatase family metal-dependent hydrolase